MPKTAQKKTSEELVKKSEKALGNPKLVEIVRNAPLTKDGKVNLTKAYDQAFDYVFNETRDLKIAKEFATSARWLAMLGRDYPREFSKTISEKLKKEYSNEFEKLVSQQKTETKDAEIELFGELIIKLNTGIEEGQLHDGHSRYFLRIKENLISHNVVEMVCKLLQAITIIGFPKHAGTVPEMRFRDYLIKILEEKFEMKIRICWNCKYYSKSGSFMGSPSCAQLGEDKILHNYSEISCEANGFRENSWISKEIPE